jgi:hypothetical protein
MSEIQKTIVKFIISSPKALAVIFFSFFSGNLWNFIILSYITKNNTKAIKHLDTNYSKISLGIIWFALIMYPIYCIKFGLTEVLLDNVFSIIWQTLLISMFFQAIFTLIIIKITK